MPGPLPQIPDEVQSRPVTRDDFRSSLGVTRASADPVAGIFGPGSMIWKVNASTLVYGLGITQAAFMDVAHPVIANGIADHSTIFADPHARAHQTYSMLTNLVFGDRDLVVRTSRALFTIHERIRGAARADEGRYASGEEYVANEGNVLLWVHATMWWVRLQTYQVLVGELTDQEREQYYRETCELAGCFAIPADLLPVDHDAWDAYVRNGPPDALAASDDSRRIMAHLRAQVPAPARAHLFAFNSVLLPGRVRTVLGLPELTPRTLRRHRQLAFVLRWAIRLLPGPLGELPPRRAAFARIAGRPQDPISRAIGRVLAGPASKKPGTKKLAIKKPTRTPLRRTR